MNEQRAVQNLLRRKLNELQAKNPAYSVRAFANRLGMQPSATNEILKGERRISLKMAERLAKKLHLDPSERSEFLRHFPVRVRRKKRLAENQGANPGAEPNPDVLRLSGDQFATIADWVHYGILNLLKTKDPRADFGWMATRLGVSETRVSGAMDRLQRLNLVRREAKGRWVRVYTRLNTTEDVLDVSIQKSHLADLELARHSLLADPVGLRDFSSIMFAVSPAILPKAKEILRRAQDEIAELAGETEATEVYRLSTYLFPITRPSNPKSP